MKLAATLGVGCALLLGACVTINVYFPAAEVEKAADKFIEKVLGEDANRSEGGKAPGSMNDGPRSEPGGSLPRAVPDNPSWSGGLAWLQRIAIVPLELLVGEAVAQANINVSTAVTKRIEASMQARHRQLSPYYAKGAIGFTEDGLVAVRDRKAVAARELGKLRQLVAADNRDREALYKEYANANGHPEWEPSIRKTFAARWVRKAPSGWYYQSGGSWKRK